MRVSVCVITFQRPDGLRRLLHGLNALTFPDDPPDIEVLVVDNDPERTAAPVCDELRPRMRWPLRYEVEPRRGIPFARNKAVACVIDDTDFVAFIDDDQVPHPSWLHELLRVQGEYGTDIVTGPVVRCLSGDVPKWVIRGNVFRLTRYPTGYQLRAAGTGNVLVRTEVFKAMDTLFDERTPFVGGTDMHFFRRAHQAGYRITWANEAVADEWFPASRVTARWVLQRAYRVGNSLTLIEKDLDPSVAVRLKLLSKTVWSVTKGVLLFPLGFLVGKRGFVRSMWHFCHAAGTIAALCGVRYEEYRKTHGA